MGPDEELASSSHSSVAPGMIEASSNSSRAGAGRWVSRASTASRTVAGISPDVIAQDFGDKERVAPRRFVDAFGGPVHFASQGRNRLLRKRFEPQPGGALGGQITQNRRAAGVCFRPHPPGRSG